MNGSKEIYLYFSEIQTLIFSEKSRYHQNKLLFLGINADIDEHGDADGNVNRDNPDVDNRDEKTTDYNSISGNMSVDQNVVINNNNKKNNNNNNNNNNGNINNTNNDSDCKDVKINGCVNRYHNDYEYVIFERNINIIRAHSHFHSHSNSNSNSNAPASQIATIETIDNPLITSDMIALMMVSCL